MKGMNNPNFAKTHGEETKALITLAKVGKSVLSDTMKLKMSIDRGHPKSFRLKTKGNFHVFFLNQSGGSNGSFTSCYIKEV